jgi:hypothetical protein
MGDAQFFYLVVGFLLSGLSIFGTMIPIILRETSPRLYSWTNMFCAGLLFSLGVGVPHDAERMQLDFERNILVAMTFAFMIFNNQYPWGGSNSSNAHKYARISAALRDDGVEFSELGGPSYSMESENNDIALETPSTLSAHIYVILTAFSYCGFIEGIIYTQEEHTGYGLLVNTIIVKFLLSICFGAAIAGDSVRTKTLPRISAVYFASSPIGFITGLVFDVHPSPFFTIFPYFLVSGVALYVSSCHLLVDELKLKEYLVQKLSCFVAGVVVIMSVRHYLY